MFYAWTLSKLKLLAAAGANFSERNIYGETPLHYYVKNSLGGGSPKIINFYIYRGINVNSLTYFGATPLHYAVLMENSNAIEILKSYGANPLIKDKAGHDVYYYITVPGKESGYGVIEKMRALSKK